MTSKRFDPDTFFARPDAVAALVTASEVFTLLTRVFDLPPQWAALVTRTPGDHAVVGSGDRITREDVEEILFVRTSPVAISLDEQVIITKDRFRCDAEVNLSVHLIAERTELLAFRNRVLGSNRTATTAAVSRYMQASIRAALEDFASARNGNDVVDAGAAGAAVEAVAEALKGPCFTAGLALDGPPQVKFTSDSLQQVRRAEEVAEQRRREHRADRELQRAIRLTQREHMDHLTALLEQLEQLAAHSPDVAICDLIRTFSEQQRGQLYEALFAAEPTGPPTQWLVVVSGDELLFFDPANLAQPQRRLRIAGKVGPVRSAQVLIDMTGAAKLLLGAATGVYVLEPDQNEPKHTYIVHDALPVQGGFNAVTAAGERILASHSELGICAWTPGEIGHAKRLFEPMTRGARSVRGIASCDGDLYCAIDDRIIRWPADDPSEHPSHVYSGSPARITALCPSSAGLFAGTSAGQILHWPDATAAKPAQLHAGTGGDAESVTLLATGGIQRVVFTDASPYVYARVLGDQFTCRYDTKGHVARRAVAADDLIVAMNDLRDRIICFKPGSPSEPFATIGIGAMTGRNISDLCLVRANTPTGPKIAG